MVVGIALTMPAVQTKIAHYFTDSLNKDFGTNITIDEVAISVFGGVKFKKVLILDHHKDTLIYSNRISTTILESKKLLNGDLIFDGLDVPGAASSIATALAGIGPGIGSVGPVANFAHLHDFSKVVMSLAMFIGRLELITFFALFTPAFWRY